MELGEDNSRDYKIERLSGLGDLEGLKKLFEPTYSQEELDLALINAIAFSKIEVAGYLLSLGADFSRDTYRGSYYAAHNSELLGLKFSISNGVNVNINNGMLLNVSIIAAINTRNVESVKWLFENGADSSLISESSLEVAKKFGNSELQSLLAKWTVKNQRKD